MRRAKPRAIRLLAALVAIGAVIYLGMAIDAISWSTRSDQWPNARSLAWVSIASCNQSLGYGPGNIHPEQSRNDNNYFTLHMFFMSLAFGLLGPMGSVSFHLLEDTLRFSHKMVKWLHAAVQISAAIFSVLGFVQIYYSNGGYCHFQAGLAALVFSNTTLFKPGSAARSLCLRLHQAVGVAVTLLGLVTIILGILAFEIKRIQWEASNAWIGPDYMEIWYKWARTGMVAFALVVMLGCLHWWRPPNHPAGSHDAKETVGEVALTLDVPAASDDQRPPA